MSDALRITVCLHGEEFLSKTFARDHILIGRDSECDLRLASASVSRQHALILKKAPCGYVLGDLHSKNGTYAGDDAVTIWFVREGGHARVGEFDLGFHFVDAPWNQDDDPAAIPEHFSERATIRMTRRSTPS